MEPYYVKPGDSLAKIGKQFGVSLTEMLKANRTLKNPNRIFPGQVVYVPTDARHPPASTQSGPTLGEFFKDALSTGGDPSRDPKFLQNVVVAVGIPIWGGPFYLYQKVANGRGTDELVLSRNEVVLFNDPLKDSFMELRMLFASRQDADAAVAKAESAYGIKGVFTYFKNKELIYPTIISDRTASALCDALRKAVEQERADAKAAAKTSTDILLWYIGARLPLKAGEGPGKLPGTAADAALSGFNAVERGVITEVRGMLSSPKMAEIRAAQAAGKEVTVKIGGRIIQYEPRLRASGMTMFGEDGFLLGQDAFTSEAEFIKTLLHETYRLSTSTIGRTGVASGAAVTSETNAAFQFAERAYNAVISGL